MNPDFTYCFLIDPFCWFGMKFHACFIAALVFADYDFFRMYSTVCFVLFLICVTCVSIIVDLYVFAIKVTYGERVHFCSRQVLKMEDKKTDWIDWLEWLSCHHCFCLIKAFITTEADSNFLDIFLVFSKIMLDIWCESSASRLLTWNIESYLVFQSSDTI